MGVVEGVGEEEVVQVAAQVAVGVQLTPAEPGCPVTLAAVAVLVDWLGWLWGTDWQKV